MTLEALKAADHLAADGVSAEVIDLRTIKPWDSSRVLASVRKTGRLVVADTSWHSYGVAAEIVATVAERCLQDLRSAPERVASPDCPSPTSRWLAAEFYPRAGHIDIAARKTLGLKPETDLLAPSPGQNLDVPDPSFKGPF